MGEVDAQGAVRLLFFVGVMALCTAAPYSITSQPHHGLSSNRHNHSCAKPSPIRFHPHSRSCLPRAPSNEQYVATLASLAARNASAPTASPQQIPRLIVIGAHKGGSSALFTFLAQHNDVRPSYCKETHFLNHFYHHIQAAAIGAAKSKGLPTDGEFVQGILRHRYSQYVRPQVPGCSPFWSVEGTPRYLAAGHPVPVRRHC